MLNITPIGIRMKTFVPYLSILGWVGFLMMAVMYWTQDDAPLPTPPVVEEVAPEPVVETDSIIEFILSQEGGYNPADPSYEGIYKPTWEWFLEVKSIADAPSNVRDLQGRMDLVHQFYNWFLYELNSGITVVPDWFQLMLADFWTTSMSASLRPLQAWADVKVDGVWGPDTERAVLARFNTLDDAPGFARWYTEQRKSYYRRLGYGESHGLLARADVVEAETLKKLHGETMVQRNQTISEDDMRLHAKPETLSLEDRLTRLEKLLMATIESR